MKFFGGAGAADNVPPLKHKRFESRLRQVIGSNETVVAGADDDDVALVHSESATDERR